MENAGFLFCDVRCTPHAANNVSEVAQNGTGLLIHNAGGRITDKVPAESRVERMAECPMHRKDSGLRIPETFLQPLSGCHVESPGLLCGGEIEHNKSVALFLIGIGHKVRDCWIGAPLIFHRVSRNALRGVTVGPPEDTGAALILPHPED